MSTYYSHQIFQIHPQYTKLNNTKITYLNFDFDTSECSEKLPTEEFTVGRRGFNFEK